MAKKLLVYFLLVLSPNTYADDTVPPSSDLTNREPTAARAHKSGNLSSDEKWILERGEIGSEAYVIGGLAGSLLGFGIGHAIQGRYTQRGWIFTLSEAGGFALLLVGLASCWDNTDPTCGGGNAAFIGGALISSGFHIWEIVDVWAYPPSHNERYRMLRERSTDFTPVGSLGVRPWVAMSKEKTLLLGARLTF